MIKKLTSGTFTHCDNEYNIVGYHKGKLQIDKKTTTGIYFIDYTVSRITRKLSNDLTITIDKIKYDVSGCPGIKFHHDEYLSNLAK